MIDSYIRTSTHALKFANKYKLEDLARFIHEYRRIARIYLDHLWDSGISWKVKNKTYYFDANTHLDHPKMLSTVEINKSLHLTTFLTQRALKCCITQVCGIIGAAIGKQRKRQYVVNKKRAHHQKIPSKLRKATRVNKPSKPDISRLNPELNSLCAQFEETDSHFDGFIKFHSLFSDRRGYKVNVPVKYTQTSKKWSPKGALKTSFLLTDKDVQFRWEVKKKLKTQGKTVGADQGLKTVLTLSDRQITPKVDNHNHSLESITKRLSRRKKGSKRFKKTQDQRANFVNWSINTLNLKGVRQVNLESIRNINYKKKSCRYMRHWCNTLIRDKLMRRCEEEEVLLAFQSSTYRSQRCSSCGLVRKSHRRGKVYCCSNCGLSIDADYNAALNHQHNLPNLSGDIRSLKRNIKGFFWKVTGCYDLDGEELTVLLSKK